VAKASRNKVSAGKSAPRSRTSAKARPAKTKASGAGSTRTAATATAPRSRPAATVAKAKAPAAAVVARPREAQPTRPAARQEMPLNNRPIPEAVPTDGKPRKNQAGLGMRDLEHFRDLLLDKRRELVGDMSQMEREALRSSGSSNLSTLPLHMADMGTDNYEQEFTLGLVQKDRDLLREINAALAKIQNGTYGICEGTGKPISKARLEAQPWAKYSIEHARQLERAMGR
jgi:RNA polymerase-binding protein DksA